MLIGDFNAHSTVWNPGATSRRDAAALEELIEIYELYVNNDSDVPTRSKTTPGKSIIDLAITFPEMEALSAWYVDSEHPTTSDHELIVVEWEEMGRPPSEVSNEVTGWDIAALLADAEASEEAAKMWKRESELREKLTDSCEREEVAEKAVWF